MDFGADDTTRGGGADDMGEWEWPRGRCEELREIESLLRCQICGDFLHGPVLLPCSHAFCSECVRKFLQTRGAHAGCCPECKQPCAPGDLVANRSMEKVALLFRQLKPKLLQVLDTSTSASGGNISTAAASSPTAPTSTGRASNGKARAVDRLPVVSYNVMKDKEVRKLLELIGIRLPVKNRDEIIQIHKEYVLLNNAQIDSCNPKSAARLREEVIRNHKLRQSDKQQADAAKKHTSASPTAALTAQMKANFERLKHEIAERKANPQRAAAAAAAAATAAESSAAPVNAALSGVPPEAVNPPTLGLSSAPVGVWRHVYSHTHKCELYVNSVTREIRLERPPEFAQQQNPKNRYDDDFEEDDDGDSSSSSAFAAAAGSGSANCSVDLTEDDAPVTVAPASRRQSLQHMTESNNSVEVIELVEPPRSTAKAAAVTSSSSSSKVKRPAGFFSSDVSAATQDFSFSSDDDDAATTHAASRRRSNTGAAAPTPTKASESIALDVGSSEDAKWDCPRCTLVNDTSAAQCEACGYESKPSASVAGSARKRQKKMHFQSKISLG